MKQIIPLGNVLTRNFVVLHRRRFSHLPRRHVEDLANTRTPRYGHSILADLINAGVKQMCDTRRTNGYEDLIRTPRKECDWQESGACVGAPPVAPLFAIKAVRVSQVGPTVATPKYYEVAARHQPSSAKRRTTGDPRR